MRFILFALRLGKLPTSDQFASRGIACLADLVRLLGTGLIGLSLFHAGD